MDMTASEFSLSTALLFINRWTSRFVSSLAFGFLAYRRDRLALHLIAGSLLNAALGKALRMAISQPRPSGSKKTSNGMPSSHANSLAYFSVATHLIAIHWFPNSQTAKVLPIVGHIYTFSVAYTRVFLTGDHTVPQVIAGAALGSTFAYCWFHTYIAPFINPV
eukprot:m.12352 g.12352  ORF g.12352 m.12352 type:complete len:163 (+) comp6846_c0_seq1:76-564(+)